MGMELSSNCGECSGTCRGKHRRGGQAHLQAYHWRVEVLRRNLLAWHLGAIKEASPDVGERDLRNVYRWQYTPVHVQPWCSHNCRRRACRKETAPMKHCQQALHL